MTDGTYRRLRVFTPAQEPYECTDVPHGTTPAEIATALYSVAGLGDLGNRRPRTIIDLAEEDASFRRLDPAIPLAEQGVSDGAALNVYPEATAGGGPIEIVLGAVVGAALVPFVQAISTKAGEEAYAAVRKLLGRRAALGDEDIMLGDRRKKVVLRVPVDALRASPPETGLGLPDGEAHSSAGRWHVVTWDPTTNRWGEERLDAPPPGTVFVRRRWLSRLRRSRPPG
ncbi:hypothetical protein [Streptomyces sp. NPDC005486]|uniref:hypothetical protein n=1 Tax=Streptomyces sp. NPDC005486 TaxID=3155345 RepID=UPI0033B86F2E